MELLLIRHGIAEERDVSRWPDDRGRPLTEEGKAKFRREAKVLGGLVPKVDALLTSELTRAAQTAEILREELGWPTPETREELEAGTDPKQMTRVLEPLEGAGAVVLVGHEPDFSEFASYLLTGDPGGAAIELKKGGVISLGIEGRPVLGEAVLYWSIPPRVLRGS
jgi:phosphohistidine phosphatase